MSTTDHTNVGAGEQQLTAEMEAQIASAMAGVGAPPAPTKSPSKGAIRGPREVRAGREHRKGPVVAIGPTDIFIEFGPKELGIAQRAQWPNEEEVPKVGDEVEVVIDRYEEGVYICSRPGTVQKADWEMLEAGQVVQAMVVGLNKGGLELEVAGHRAFMPASQVSSERVPDLNVYIGQKLACTVTKVERAGRGNIVLSRRDVLDGERKEQGKKLRETLAEGQTLDGVIRKIMPFGVFVDLGGLDGLVHATDLTYERAPFGEKAIAKYVQEGQSVRVQVLKLDWENNRIALGMKQVQGDPFQSSAADIKEGDEVTGRVVRITEFGAFVEIATGVDGLVHISELDHKRIARVEDVLKVDEIIKAKVVKIDREQRRISLSIRALKPMPEMTMGGGGGGGMGGGGMGGSGPGGGGMGGKGKKTPAGRSAEEILKVTPELRRLREKFNKSNFKGGLG